MAWFKRNKKQNADQTHPTVEDYEALGKQVAALYDHINPDRKGLYRTAFLKGVVGGLGGVIGATVVIAILAWLLALLGHLLPFDSLFDSTRETIQQKR